MLYHAYGVTGRRAYPSGVLLLRAAPSAGALYPLDLFVMVRDMEGLADGMNLYIPTATVWFPGRKGRSPGGPFRSPPCWTAFTLPLRYVPPETGQRGNTRIGPGGMFF